MPDATSIDRRSSQPLLKRLRNSFSLYISGEIHTPLNTNRWSGNEQKRSEIAAVEPNCPVDQIARTKGYHR
jgi:hypothetical protein